MDFLDLSLKMLYFKYIPQKVEKKKVTYHAHKKAWKNWENNRIQSRC